MEWSCAACGAKWPESHGFCAFCGQARGTVEIGTAEVDEVLRALVGDQLRAELVAQGGRLPEERRLVSAIFADLSGFTPLAGQLDPETLAEVVDPILEALVRIVKRGEGYVGSFAGDALLAYFGAPVTHEDDAVRAVRCAQEMLAEFPALIAVAPPEAAQLSLRIGVDTGAVMARLVAGDIKTDYNILGNSVNMAQRLQSNAPPGGCVVGETTYRLAKDAFDFEDLGGLQVKGRADPLPAWLLTGERARAVQRREQRTARIVGRDDELAQIAAVESAGGALVLLAEAGAGKSRLLEEARHRSTRTWREGGCVPHDSATSYRVWVAALAEVSSSSDGLRILRGDLDADLAALPPARRRDVVANDVISALNELAPLVLVLEDLHWADQPTVDLLDDVLHTLPDDVAVLATSREPLSLTASAPILDVAPLVDDAVAALVADLLGGDPPEVLITDIARRSGGNPLYVAELALALRDRGLVELVEGGVLVASGAGLEGGALDLVPDSLEGLIGARIDALPNAQERALSIAAVLGAPVREELVTAVAVQLALPHHEIHGALDGLRAARLLDGDQFVHAVVQNTAYMRTTRARRRTLHLAAADACRDLVSDDERAGFLARHLYLAGAGPRAVDALENAAADALKFGRHEEAVLHLRREIELRRGGSAAHSPGPETQVRLLVLGELLELLGRYLEAEAVLRPALATAPAAARGLVGCLRRLGRHAEAVELADEALRSMTLDVDTRSQISNERSWSLAAQGRLDEALADAATTDAPDAGARAALLSGYVLQERGDLEGALSAFDFSIRMALSLDQQTLACRGMRLRGEALGLAARLDEARASLLAALELARRVGAAEESMLSLSFLTAVSAWSGDLPAAVAYSRQAVTASDRLRHANGRATSRNNHAFALFESGEFEASVQWASEAIAISEAAGLDLMEAEARHSRGSALLALNRFDDAEHDARMAERLYSGTREHALAHELRAAITAARSRSAGVDTG